MPPPALRTAASLLLLAPLALLAACAETDPPPRWIELAEGFQPRPVLEVARGWLPPPTAAREVTLRPHGERGKAWIETTLQRGEWEPEGDGIFRAERPRWGPFAQAPPSELRLAAGERSFERRAEKEAPAPGAFLATADALRIALEPGESPPEEVMLAARIDSGHAQDGSWRVRAGHRSGNAIPVWCGGREEVVSEVPERSRLRLLTTLLPPAVHQGPWSATFRVTLDGEVVLEHEQSGQTTEQWHEIDLAASRPGPLRAARIGFEVEGEAGLGLFFHPTVGPAEIGTYAERPWGASRPDLVLFLADTFRADNLAAYGGDPALAPTLNALAERSLVFTEARAPATWTLPSVGSLLTGVYPGEHGATQKDLALSYDLRTLAELLSDHGYRTGAITDAGFFSGGFGLDQGFDWFVEHGWPDWNLDRNVDEALEFLDRDDGRPVLLVLHTYRTHGPYRVGPEEDTSAWDALMEEGWARIRAAAEDGEQDEKLAVFLSLAERFRELYLAGVRDLDRGFARFERGLAARGLDESGYLLFTSDHGEAFGENDDAWHGRELWEVKLRVPLLLSGPGIEPAHVSAPATLLDVPTTLARLAGAEPPSHWNGRDLLDLPAERAVFAFRFDGPPHLRQVAILEEKRKVLAALDPDRLRRGEYALAFDLARDPAEEHAIEGAEWPAALCRGLAEHVAELLTPRTPPQSLGADPEIRRQLLDIGYGGG